MTLKALYDGLRRFSGALRVALAERFTVICPFRSGAE
jgi:hypothetical protein